LSGDGGIALIAIHNDSLPTQPLENNWIVGVDPHYPEPPVYKSSGRAISRVVTAPRLADSRFDPQGGMRIGPPPLPPPGRSGAAGNPGLSLSPPPPPARDGGATPFLPAVDLDAPIASNFTSRAPIASQLTPLAPRPRMFLQTFSWPAAAPGVTLPLRLDEPSALARLVHTYAYVSDLAPGMTPIPGRTYVLIVPYWIPSLVLALPAAVIVAASRRSYKRRRRRARGECQNCGYDLRESPQRCPECGASAARDASNVTSTFS
jgi:hypothetical protein